jgi:hypothetical protein
MVVITDSVLAAVSNKSAPNAIPQADYTVIFYGFSKGCRSVNTMGCPLKPSVDE